MQKTPQRKAQVIKAQESLSSRQRCTQRQIMFTPIKKIFTYIQKNASGRGMFGGTTSPVTSVIEIDECEETAKNMKTIVKTTTATTATTNTNPLNMAEMLTKSTELHATETVIIDDDIELQIKPSILINRPKIDKEKRHGMPTPVATSSRIRESNRVESQSTQRRTIISKVYRMEMADEELADFAHAPTELPTNGIASVESEQVPPLSEYDDEDFVDADADVDDDLYAGDDLEKAYLELDAFEDKNIIVLNEEAEHNVSITSDNNSEDPLAIDDFSLAENPLDTLTTNLSIIIEDDDERDNNEHAETTTVRHRRRTGLWTVNNTDEQHPTIATNSDTQQLSSICSRKPIQDQQETQTHGNDGSAGAGLEFSLPKTNRAKQHVEAVDELRSDGGSDSGLGSETSALLLQSTNTSLVETSQLGSSSSSAVVSSNQMPQTEKDILQVAYSNASDLGNALSPKTVKPLRSNLKRPMVEVDVVDALDVDDNSEHAKPSESTTSSTTAKRAKRSINFDNVQVYYFPRQQGFNCVPTVGGCTLGMGARHIGFKTLTLAEHAAELRRAHRMQMQEVQPRGGSSSDETEESEEDYLSDGSGSDPDGESNGFLQPVTPKQRRALLKAAGVRKIDASEKIDCRDIRNSREVCGCSCREFCDPETCACSQAGIKCQVDRSMFPCGCTREACGNTVGRVEFNPTRVRTHFIHTIMRLDLEQRQEQQQQTNNLAYALTANSSTSAGYYGHMQQPQSNYSSGYASPAYTSDAATAANYYQTPQQAQQLTPSIASGTYIGGGTLPDLHTPPQYQLAVDSLDANLFVSGSNATPSYGELIQHPTYQSLSNTQISNYYHHLHHPPHHQPPNAPAYHRQLTTPAYSSCAVPSAPPFGNATTTCATANYHPMAADNTNHNNNNSNNTNSGSAAIIQSDTVLSANIANCPPSLIITPTPQLKHLQQHQHQNNNSSCDVTGSEVLSNTAQDVNRFISLSSPNASSSRLSQINDLLRHNRNTTIALVAVSESPRSVGYALHHNGSISNNNINNNQAINNASSTSTTAAAVSASIDTPPIEDAHKHCLAFEQLAPTLSHPAPIVGVVQEATLKSMATSSTAAVTGTGTSSAVMTQQPNHIIATLPASTTIRRIN